jgi:hypothetical protein
LEKLRSHLAPSFFPSSYQINMGSPDNKNGDYIVGIYLYDISLEQDVARPTMMGSGINRQKKTPVCYRLSYMIYLNDSSQTGIYPMDGQKIMGKITQILNDTSLIPVREVQPSLAEPEPDIRLTSIKLDLEEKFRIWQALSVPYRLSLHYQATPIFVSSEYEEDIYRVQVADIHVHNRQDLQARP